MNTSASQIKISLPEPLYDFLNSKASKYGMTMSSYVKNLILNDVKDMEFPSYQASKKIEASYKQALGELESAKEIKNLDKYFANL